jgi:hypothetical protein
MERIASRLEQLGTNGELAPALELLTHLRSEFDEVSRFLDAYSRSQEDSDPEHP